MGFTKMLTAKTPDSPRVLSPRAASMSFSWPACRAPMVGTKPIFFLDSRAPRTSLTVWTTRTYVLDVCARRRNDLFRELCVWLGKWRRRSGKAERVVADEHLPAAW